MPLIWTPSVAGVSAPAFVERFTLDPVLYALTCACVAGVSAPAFVERSSRPRRGHTGLYGDRVAGVSAPAFVERARGHFD